MQIRQGAQSFQGSVFPELREHFEKLTPGQSPEVLFITCSDSRIDPALVTQSHPGELFILRNAGNFVSTAFGSGEAATIEYGVKVLGVKHIVVCGHSHCGAVTAALDPSSVKSLPAVAAWLVKAGPSLASFEPRAGEERVFSAVCHNARQQVERLRELAFVAEAELSGSLELHAWVYRFETGEVLEHDPASDRFAVLSDTDLTPDGAKP